MAEKDRSRDFTIETREAVFKCYIRWGEIKPEKTFMSGDLMVYLGQAFQDVHCNCSWDWNRFKKENGGKPGVFWDTKRSDPRIRGMIQRATNVAVAVAPIFYDKKDEVLAEIEQTTVVPQQTEVPTTQQINSAASVIAGAIDFGDDEIVYDDEECIVEEVKQSATNRKKVNIWTDGACSGNGKDDAPGGYGILFKMGEHTRQLSGFDPSTTNNRMELMSAIVALETLKYPCDVELRSDSKYLVDGVNQWLSSWVKKGWKKSDGDDVKNQDLWKRLVPLLQKHNVVFVWEKGHDPVNNPENAICDGLATSEYLKRR